MVYSCWAADSYLAGHSPHFYHMKGHRCVHKNSLFDPFAANSVCFRYSHAA